MYVAFVDLATLRAKHAALSPVLTGRSPRGWAATEAQAISYGGIVRVARALASCCTKGQGVGYRSPRQPERIEELLCLGRRSERRFSDRHQLIKAAVDEIHLGTKNP